MINQPDLSFLIDKFFSSLTLNITNLKIVEETNDDEACSFLINQTAVVYRKAKITPKKIGYFVSIWKRNEYRVTVPQHFNDQFDLLMISVRNQDLFGCFIFSKQILLANGIISTVNREGKRGFRLYAPWDNPQIKQAINTQIWQSAYFINFSNQKEIDFNKLKLLLKK